MGFGEEENIRRVRSDKVNTIGMFWTKLGGNRTINVEKREGKGVFKSRRER